MTSHWPGRGAIWTVAWAGSGQTLGWCGLFPIADTALIEIGYRYVTAAWGRGVATEAARRVLGHGFRAFEFDPIVAVTHPENTASKNVLKKIGLCSDGRQFHHGLDLGFFSLGRADYLSAQ
jgi:RimJ/RimL family protein N-acetyltransferase